LLDLLLVGLVVWDASAVRVLIGEDFPILELSVILNAMLTFILLDTFALGSVEIFLGLTSVSALILMLMQLLIIGPIFFYAQAKIKHTTLLKFSHHVIVLLQRQHGETSKKRIDKSLKRLRSESSFLYGLYSWLVSCLPVAFGLVMGMYSYVFGLILPVSLVIFLTILVKDIYVFFKKETSEEVALVELPIEESFILVKRDGQFYIQCILGIPVIGFAVLNIADSLYLVSHIGPISILIITTTNFLILLLVQLQYLYFLTKKQPDFTYSHRGGKLLVCTISLMFLIQIIWIYISGPQEIFLIPKVVWILLLVITLIGMAEKTESSEMAYTLRIPIFFFLSLLPTTHYFILFGQLELIILVIVFTLIISLILTVFRIEYPRSLVHWGVLGLLISSLIFTVPVGILIQVPFVLTISIMAGAIIYSKSWRKFSRIELANPNLRALLFIMLGSSTGFVIEDLDKEFRLLPDIEKASLKPIISRLTSEGIIKVEPSIEGPLYSIRSTLLRNKIEDFKKTL
jgi:hypothetical protein